MKKTESVQSKIMSIKHLWKNVPVGNSVNAMVFFEHFNWHVIYHLKNASQPAITCSKLTKETLEQGVKYVQS